MSYKRSFYPEILIHPWMSLKDILESEDMTQKDLSLRTEISEKHISNIIKAKANITPETALKLEKVFWISSDYWNNLQKAYDEDLARLEEQKLIENTLEQEKEIISNIEVYNDLSSLWFVEDTRKKNERLNSLYSFFWVSSLKNILDIFKLNQLAFKKSDTLNLNRYNLACWLRAWEIKIKDNDIEDYSKKKLEEVLKELKIMTKDNQVDIWKIKELLASAWIHFSYIHWFKNVPVYWITRKYKWKPFIQVSDRGKRTDTFWFALFHELAHVQLHLSKKDDIFINIDDKEEDIEKQANDWASWYLIESEEYEKFLSSWNITVENLIEFAWKIWVWAHIVAWRVAYDHDAYHILSDFRKPLEIINN